MISLDTVVWVLVAMAGSLLGGALFAVAMYFGFAVYMDGIRRSYILMSWFLKLKHQKQIVIKIGLLVAVVILIGASLDWMLK